MIFSTNKKGGKSPLYKFNYGSYGCTNVILPSTSLDTLG